MTYGGPKNITVRYIHQDGHTNTCVLERTGSDERVEYADFNKTLAGPGGLAFFPEGTARTEGSVLMPMTYEQTTGRIWNWFWTGQKWRARGGWVQNEAPRYAVEQCPNLPVVGAINVDQYYLDTTRMSERANKITGAEVIFDHERGNPFTVGMLYWAYPPVQ